MILYLWILGLTHPLTHLEPVPCSSQRSSLNTMPRIASSTQPRDYVKWDDHVMQPDLSPDCDTHCILAEIFLHCLLIVASCCEHSCTDRGHNQWGFPMPAADARAGHADVTWPRSDTRTEEAWRSIFCSFVNRPTEQQTTLVFCSSVHLSSWRMVMCIERASRPFDTPSLCSISYSYLDSWLTLNHDLCFVLQTFNLQNHLWLSSISLRTNCVLSSHTTWEVNP